MTLHFIERAQERMRVDRGTAEWIEREVRNAIIDGDERLIRRIMRKSRHGPAVYEFRAKGRSYYALWNDERREIVTLLLEGWTVPRGKASKRKRRRLPVRNWSSQLEVAI